MEFSFKIQQYQTDAVDAVVKVFEGQPKIDLAKYRRDLGLKVVGAAGERSAAASVPVAQSLFGNEGLKVEKAKVDGGVDEEMGDGFANPEVLIGAGRLVENIKKVQGEQNIHLSEGLVEPLGACSLDVEMETGTGKTYVYIKTMFELRAKYGWSKFIVVVPSVAIREGVKKSFEVMERHFMECYHEKARFFVYDSDNLSKIDSFSSDSGLNVMIINTQAFATSLNEAKGLEGKNGAARIIYTARDEFASRKPIDVIKANRPILILDEPQKMGDAKSVTQKALANFNPLFTLNYSATHKKHHNSVYVLDALDAYNQKLVKRIAVKGFEVHHLRGTNSYIYLEQVILSAKEPPRVRLEIEVRGSKGPKKEFHIFGVGDNLYFKSKKLEEYRNFVIAAIDPLSGVVEFTNGVKLQKGEVMGNVNEEEAIRRVQIRETIISHLEREQALFKMGIKTLSLFFIDEVSKYRQYDADGNEKLGEYGKVFEEEYVSVLNEKRDLFDDPEYIKYLDAHCVQELHKGYFSIDKHGRSVNSSLKRGTDVSDDISAYDLILKNKERLLSFEEPTRFIFSHSALREGWDNPNVFQICTLKKSDSTTQKRQEVGRGLRLCVNQRGERMDAQVLGERVQDINMLTVIASESYASFVDALQKQTMAEIYERPRVASEEYFKKKVVRVGDESITLEDKHATAIYNYLVRNNYIDDDKKVTQKYRDDVAGKTLAPLPEKLQPMEEGIHHLIQAIYDETIFKQMCEDGNKPAPIPNPLNARFGSKEFQALWKEINHHCTYKVSFDSDELIRKAVDHIDSELSVSRLMYTVIEGVQKGTGTVEDIRGGSGYEEKETKTNVLKDSGVGTVRYDLIGQIAEGTVLTRRTVATILKKISGAKFAMYRSNPEEFIRKVIVLINEQKAALTVEHITYDTIDKTYDSNIFVPEPPQRIDEKRRYTAKKAIQEYIVVDGIAEDCVERKFAEKLDHSNEVLVYAKLPRGFQIPTPVGNYTPDWAIVFREGKVKHIYFIAETKGTMESLELRPIEKAKIDCAKKLFKKLSNGKVTYGHVDNYDELLNQVMK